MTLNFHWAFKRSFWKFSNTINCNKGGMIKYLLTELGRAWRENIWLSVMAQRPGCARSICHDLVCTYWLSGRAGRENIWLEVMASYAMTSSQIFSRPARPNSVNKHFIIWPSRFFFQSFPGIRCTRLKSKLTNQSSVRGANWVFLRHKEKGPRERGCRLFSRASCLCSFTTVYRQCHTSDSS